MMKDLKIKEMKKLELRKIIREELLNERNIKRVEIVIPNEAILKKINNTPTLKKLSRLTLKVGSNFENVNHYQYSSLMRMYPLLGVEIKEL